MDLLRNAKAIRLKSHHDKFLLADEDEETVTQDRNGASRNAKWTVEFLEEKNVIRLRSCYNKYLTASNLPFLFGMTGRKILQTLPRRLDSSLEWEPEKDGSKIRFRTRFGNYLRANGGLPPWRNSVTHDVPHRTVTKDWVLWDVDIVEIVEHSDEIYNNDSPKVDSGPVNVVASESFGSESSSVSVGSDRFERQESNDYGTYKQHSPPKADGRLIYYHVADDVGIIDEGMEGNSFTFKGHNVAELTRKLEEETGLEDIFVCTRSPLNGKLYPLRLQLPPNNAAMHIVVVPSTSRLAREFGNGGIS